MNQKVMNPDNLLIAYVYDDGGVKEYYFEYSAENIANFIGRIEHMLCEKIILTNMYDEFILSTRGWFIDDSPDQELNRQIVSFLAPIQMGEAELKDILVYTREEMEQNPELYGGTDA